MKLAILVILIVWGEMCSAASAVEMKTLKLTLHDQAKLQRGAKFFMNYCSGCHALRYMRYNRMARDLGLTTFDGAIDKTLLMNNLVFTEAKPQDPIQISMPQEDARSWFGIMPPDLSLSARERGAAWLYTYLKSFYSDPKRPFGANNLLVPDVAMPNVLAPLQGTVILEQSIYNQDRPHRKNLILIERGSMTQQQFDSALEDIVHFLVYVSEPDRLLRYRIGTVILIFLMVFAFFAYRLKRFYWRAIH